MHAFSFDRNKYKHDYYRGKYCMKNFCKDLREIKNVIIKNVTIENLMLPLTEEENKLRKNKIFVIKSGKKN